MGNMEFGVRQVDSEVLLTKKMSQGACNLRLHLDRFLTELQSNLANQGACNDSFSSTFETEGPCPPISNEIIGSSQISIVSNSESDDTSSSCGCNCAKYYREETRKLVHQLGDSRVQIATLEAHISFFTSQVEERETLDSLYIQKLEEEVLQFKDRMKLEVSNLAKRQSQVEQKVPSLEEQFKTIQDFDISESLYLEIKSILEQQRTAKENVQILAYEKFLHDQEVIRELQVSCDTSREALTRANDEVQRLITEDLQKAAAKANVEQQESKDDSSANLALMEQLEAERRESRVQIEALNAKGSLLDEVQAKLETLQSASIVAEKEKAAMATSLQATLQEKDHVLDLLSKDKAYLSMEVESWKDQVRKLESELEQQHEKLREARRERTELRRSSVAANERFQAEISQIEERLCESIERSRRESSALADEKLQTFRELRDEATAAAETRRKELRESKIAYEELLSKSREFQIAAASTEAEAQRSLTLTNSELEQLKVALAEKTYSLDQTRLENDALITNLQTQTQLLNEEKTALEKSLLEVKEELKTTREQLEGYQRAEAERIESLEREKAKSFSSWTVENAESPGSKFNGSIHENQLTDQSRRVPRERACVSIQMHSVQGEIRKLLRARGSVDQLRSILKEKVALLGEERRSNSIPDYSRSSLKERKEMVVGSPRICNLDRNTSPTRQELQAMIEHGESPPKCFQHRACSPHYQKAYEKLVDAMSRQAPAPYSLAPPSASLSSALVPAPAPSSSAAPTSAQQAPAAAFSPGSPRPSASGSRNSCS